MNKNGWIGILIIGVIIIALCIVGFFMYSYFFKVDAPKGAIHWTENGKDIYCTDSDNGSDIYNRGTLKLYDKSGTEIRDPQGEIYSDSCFGENKVMKYKKISPWG